MYTVPLTRPDLSAAGAVESTAGVYGFREGVGGRVFKVVSCAVPDSALPTEALTGRSIAKAVLELNVSLALLGHMQPAALTAVEVAPPPPTPPPPFHPLLNLPNPNPPPLNLLPPLLTPPPS